MKKLSLLFSALTFIILCRAQPVRTSIAAGFFTSPLNWDCTCVPFPGDSVIINHAMTLNTDWGYSSGALMINASGSLIGDNANRGFATLGGGRFYNNGTFGVARVGFFGGTVINDGTFAADSLYANVVAGSGLATYGNMSVSTDFLNIGNFLIGSAAAVSIGGDFMHGDSINPITPALFCAGSFVVSGDFANLDTIRGFGQICIYGNSANFGTVTGTLKMCDVTGGGNVDFNAGTISGTVLGCAASTCVGVGIENIPSLTIQVYPNPASDFIQIKSDHAVKVIVFDLMGKVIYQSTTANQIQNISINEWASGVYTYRVFTDKGISTGKFIKQ